jgi:hypothetical protein
MKQFKFLPVILIFAVLLSACGAPPAPTMSPQDVQNTAVAAAFTVVAQTQEAIPTATPLPPTSTPTETPLPTSTPLPLPTSATLVATTAVSNVTTNNGNATVDPCSTRVLNYSPKGQPTTIRIVNMTKAQVTVSLYLNETPGKGECGYRSYTLGKNGDVVITDLVQGCYNLWAWSTDNKVHVNAGGSGCINNPDKWTFQIGENSIKFTVS